MGHKLILEVSEDIYEPLAKTAKETGTTPEEVAVEWLADATRNAIDDPVEGFIGAFSSGIPDWADQHDRYLGQVLREQMRGEGDEDN